MDYCVWSVIFLSSSRTVSFTNMFFLDFLVFGIFESIGHLGLTSKFFILIELFRLVSWIDLTIDWFSEPFWPDPFSAWRQIRFSRSQYLYWRSMQLITRRWKSFILRQRTVLCGLLCSDRARIFCCRAFLSNVDFL